MITGIIAITGNRIYALKYEGVRKSGRVIDPIMGDGTLYLSDANAQECFVPDIATKALEKIGDETQAELLMTGYFLVSATTEWGVKDYGQYWKSQVKNWLE